MGSNDLDRLTVTTEGVNVAIPTAWTFSNARLNRAGAALRDPGAYQKGRTMISESTEAYNFLYDARGSLIQALYDAKIAEARLERAIGANF